MTLLLLQPTIYALYEGMNIASGNSWLISISSCSVHFETGEVSTVSPAHSRLIQLWCVVECLYVGGLEENENGSVARLQKVDPH